MNVLSLFDGMSCGQIALKELGLNVETYYASEVDKHAIKVTQHNFPNTIQLGDVIDVDVSKLKPIDLLIGGSPCTDLSIAGDMRGMSSKGLNQYLELKEQGFKFEGQSYLFWEYVRILKEIQKYNPDVLFLLENVPMLKKWERLITESLGVFSVRINSALVSAQNRNRLYWTNIKTKKVGIFGEVHSDIPQPKDRKLILKDVLEKEVDEKYFISDKLFTWLKKHSEKRSQKINIRSEKEKSSTLTLSDVKLNLETNYVLDQIGYISTNSQANRVYNPKGKSVSLQANAGGGGAKTGLYNVNQRLRRLTPTEAKRLQTIPDWYDMSVISETQQYRCLGNGWTVEVIKHIFSFIN